MFSHWNPDYFAIYHNWFKIQIQCKVHTEYRPSKCEVLIFLKSIFKRGQNFSLVEEWAGLYGRQTLKEQYHKVLTLVFLAELTNPSEWHKNEKWSNMAAISQIYFHRWIEYFYSTLRFSNYTAEFFENANISAKYLKILEDINKGHRWVKFMKKHKE